MGKWCDYCGERIDLEKGECDCRKLARLTADLAKYRAALVAIVEAWDFDELHGYAGDAIDSARALVSVKP